MNNQQESKNIKLNNSDFTFLANQKPWLKIPADGSPLTFTGNADEAAKEFFNALIRVRDGYISALKAERDAQQKRADALAVENENQRDWINKCSELWDAGCDLDNLLGLIPETPATDAALAAIQAQGVEKFADDLHKTAMATCSVKPDNTTPGAYAGLARSFAKKLREAK
ncbi:hypothetical protein [Serratia marcescens]|uniref:hypothetical protein n=1 Tax=Serratia marcescens TaxID=615 RepID=UPI000744F3B5|nr:hypothetical protein [Serratia marcescens]CVF69422.1 Uncharacterised protein [Serratia marcescens]